MLLFVVFDNGATKTPALEKFCRNLKLCWH